MLVMRWKPEGTRAGHIRRTKLDKRNKGKKNSKKKGMARDSKKEQGRKRKDKEADVLPLKIS